MPQPQLRLDKFSRTQKMFFWIRVNFIWLIPIVLTVFFVSVWIFAATKTQENHTTNTINLGNYGLPELNIRIQYPNSLSGNNFGKNSKTIIIFISGTFVQISQKAKISLIAPEGIINFIDPKGNRLNSKLEIDLSSASQKPIEINIEHAQTKEAEHFEFGHFLTVVEISGSTTVPVTELAFDVQLETTTERVFREFGSSALGTIAPLLTFAVSVWGIFNNIYSKRKKIEPVYKEIQRCIKNQEWKKVIELCQKIIDIDPTYDSIVEVRENAYESLEAQIKELYAKAETAYWNDKNFQTAITYYKKIVEIDEFQEKAKQRIKECIEIQKKLDSRHSLSEGELAKIPDAENSQISELILQLADNINWERAAESLANIGQPSVNLLLEALGERFPVWRRALNILAEIVQDDIEILLRQNILSENINIRENSIKALELLYTDDETKPEEL